MRPYRDPLSPPIFSKNDNRIKPGRIKPGIKPGQDKTGTDSSTPRLIREGRSRRDRPSSRLVGRKQIRKRADIRREHTELVSPLFNEGAPDAQTN